MNHFSGCEQGGSEIRAPPTHQLGSCCFSLVKPFKSNEKNFMMKEMKNNTLGGIEHLFLIESTEEEQKSREKERDRER